MRLTVNLAACALVVSAASTSAEILNSAVRQETIAKTICVTGYTKTIRPPVGYTTKLKITQIRARGFKGGASDYQEDHLIPLALGGHPTDPENLWPQPWPDAKVKDVLERKLHRQVCNGEMPLAEAQNVFKRWPLPKQ